MNGHIYIPGVYWIGISALSGFLYGLICLLVPYVGFFTLGFHAGLLLGLITMIFFPITYSIWISIIFLLGAQFPSLNRPVSNVLSLTSVN